MIQCRVKCNYYCDGIFRSILCLRWIQRVLFSYINTDDGRCVTNVCLDDWLTVHRSIPLVDLQLDAQNSYLITYNIFIKILYMFRALPRSSSGGLRHNCIYAVSGIVTLCRWLSCAPVKKELFFLTGVQDSHLQGVTIPEAAYIQFRRRPSEDERGNARNM
jgi:hypothetical protein